jgi:hypothetical protein
MEIFQSCIKIYQAAGNATAFRLNMKTLTIVNLHHKNFCDYKIDRSTPLGNPFVLSKTQTREIVCGKYKDYLYKKIKERDKQICDCLLKIYYDALNDNDDKKEITLGCWCAPKQCHGEIIAEVINKMIERNVYQKKFSWARRSPDKKTKTYECSTVGDKTLSAFNAKLEDGRTIEQHYQCDIKQYDVGGTNWRLGKGKPPKTNINKEELYKQYYNLWLEWSKIKENREYLIALKKYLINNEIYILTDAFASSDINQAHALSDILDDYKL